MREIMKNLKILDKYISKQLIDTFLLGIVIFTTILFASDAFLTIVKQIAVYGIPFKVALIAIILQLPSFLVLTIPMGVLLSTILTFNKLSLNSEISIMRACGISISRLTMPVIVFGLMAAVLSFIINEFIVPASNMQARNLTIWAIGQRSIPEGKSNFSFKELGDNSQLKRLFYVNNYANDKLQGVTVLDLSKKGTIQIIQSKYGSTDHASWNFNEGAIYSISSSGKILNTASFDKMKMYSNFKATGKYKNLRARELGIFDLVKYIRDQKQKKDVNTQELVIQLHEKFAIPVTAFLVAIIGVPLAITPPRAKFNRGLLFSIFVIFCYYLIRAFSVSLGEAQVLNPVFSAWLPDIIIGLAGAFLFYRKAYLI